MVAISEVDQPHRHDRSRAVLRTVETLARGLADA
jgi:hypothetical protein